MSEIDRFLSFILDKDWLDTDEIVDVMKMDRVKLGKIVEFLAEFRLIEVGDRKIRICADTNDFLKSVSRRRKV
jgi:NADH:ubiquinone oxidoreductase subunit E